MNDAEIRADILDTAKGYVLKDRNSTYGSPEDNFRRIARRWTAHLQNVGVISDAVQLNATDVAIMMTDMKLARIEHNPGHKDSWIDAAGYIACGAGIALAEPFQQEGTNLDMNFKGLTDITYTGKDLPGKGLATRLAQEAIYKVQAQQAVEQFQKACPTQSPSSGSPS